MGLINGTVSLDNDYNEWKKIFANEKNILEDIFGKYSFKIEHVGSTSVKGLSAKPIVDITVGVNSLKDVNKYMSKLKDLYTIKRNVIDNEILLIKENEKETFCLIHVLPLKSKRYQNMMRFKDILINNKDILLEYENLKQKLASEYTNDRKTYTKSKNDYIEKILENH